MTVVWFGAAAFVSGLMRVPWSHGRQPSGEPLVLRDPDYTDQKFIIFTEHRELRPKAPKLATFMDEAEHDVLAYMNFPKEHRAKLHSTNPIERLHGEIERRTNVIGIFPNEGAITRLVGAILLEQNDEWALSRRYRTLESIAQTSDNLTVKRPAVAA